MKKNHEKLLQFLSTKEKPVTSKELSEALNVSIRSIKNYVNEINLNAKKKVIISNNNGYVVHKKSAASLIQAMYTDIPQSDEERAFYIIKTLLTQEHAAYNLYDLSDDLFISYSKLKQTIQYMNKAYKNFEVKFRVRQDELYMDGLEKSKRKLMSYVIYEETNQTLIDTSILNDSFPKIDTTILDQIIHRTFQNHNYYLNDFAHINLLLHLVIMLDRIKDGNYMNKRNSEYPIEDDNERSLVIELCTALEDSFQVQLTSEETIEIYMLFKTNANHSLPSNQDTLEKFVGKSILSLVREVVKKINDNYYINLENESFLTPFSLHLKNLILRARNNTYTKNPMRDSIKTSCPTVYDVSIYIAMYLSDTFDIQIHEDEIAFLALHIGSEIERQKTNDEKVKTILLCPSYMGIHSNLYNQLLITFGSKMDIIKTISSQSELNKYDFDLCITTIDINVHLNRQIIKIPPFLQQNDITNIFEALRRVEVNKNHWILRKYFHHFFSDELFITSPVELDRDDIIHEQIQKLIVLQYVDDSFEEKVQIREKAASTAFGEIAIPHTMRMEAMRSSISVCISKEGILWGEQKVHIVLLVALNKTDKNLFHVLYEAIIELFGDEEILRLVKACTSFKDFETVIFDQTETG